MHTRTITQIASITYLALCLGGIAGCSGHQDVKPDAAKMDRSKIDEEVYKGQNAGDAASGEAQNRK